MKLTEKDKGFLDQLRKLMHSGDLSVALQPGLPSYMVLRGSYGQGIATRFRMTRQGVRWRFAHVFNHIYVSAFESILAIEKAFGPGLRDHAVRISKERYRIYLESNQRAFETASSFLHLEKNKTQQGKAPRDPR